MSGKGRRGRRGTDTPVLGRPIPQKKVTQAKKKSKPMAIRNENDTESVGSVKKGKSKLLALTAKEKEERSAKAKRIEVLKGRIIPLVETRRHLYDKQDPDYHNKNKWRESWLQIAEELDEPDGKNIDIYIRNKCGNAR